MTKYGQFYNRKQYLLFSNWTRFSRYVGKLSQDTGNQINRSDYGSGYTLFAFNLTPDHCPGDDFELIKEGNLRLELHFSGGTRQHG